MLAIVGCVKKKPQFQNDLRLDPSPQEFNNEGLTPAAGQATGTHLEVSTLIGTTPTGVCLAGGGADPGEMQGSGLRGITPVGMSSRNFSGYSFDLRFGKKLESDRVSDNETR